MQNSASIPLGDYATLASGLRIHYLEAGPADGEVVIFLHGSGSGASAYSNFKGNYPAFAKAGFRVILMDLPGYGLSDKPDVAHYDLDFFVSALSGLVDTLKLHDLSLVGNSLGGAVALGFALAAPQLTQRLILMAPGGIEPLETYFAMPGIARMFAVFQSGRTGADAMREVMQLQLHDPAMLTDDIVAERVPIAALQTQAARSPMKIPDMSARLGEVRCPILGFWGINDQFTPASGAQKILAGAPRARFVLLNQCGHWVQLEHRDLFNRTCIDFLHHG